MKIAIRFYSRSGNTEKIAKAISEALGVEALPVSEQLTEDVDVLFLGSAVYAYGIDEKIKEFILGIDVKVGKVVNFSTAAVIKSSYKQVAKLLKAKNIPLSDEQFYCRGAFSFLHKDRPNENDCKAAAEFAKKIVGV